MTQGLFSIRPTVLASLPSSSFPKAGYTSSSKLDSRVFGPRSLDLDLPVGQEPYRPYPPYPLPSLLFLSIGGKKEGSGPLGGGGTHSKVSLYRPGGPWRIVAL